MAPGTLGKMIECFESLLTFPMPDANPWFRCLVDLYNFFVGGLQRLSVFAMTGELNGTDSKATILSIGRDESAHEFARIVCSQVYDVRFLGKMFCWQVDPTRFSGYELIGTCMPKHYVGRFEKSGNFVLPEVALTLDLKGSIDSITARMSRRRRRDVKKLLALNYSYFVSSKNRDDFAFFYSKMYLPYIRTRFDDAACIRPYFKSWSLYARDGGILFVKTGSTLISGIQFQTKGRTVYALALGVSEDNLASERDYAGQAALFFLIEWAKAHGFNRLNYGPTMPFLKDGIFVYKKEWGMTIEGKVDPYYYTLGLGGIRQGTMDFLQRNPFLFLDEGSLKALIFVGSETARAPLTEIVSDYFMKGLDSFVIVNYESPANKNQTASHLGQLHISTGKTPHPLMEIGTHLTGKGSNLKTLEVVCQRPREAP